MSAKLSAGGKGHRILTRLLDGPAAAHELTGVATNDGPQKARSKAWRVLGAMKEHGLVVCVASEYRITDAGRAAWETLERGRPCWLGSATPNVRVFRPAA